MIAEAAFAMLACARIGAIPLSGFRLRLRFAGYPASTRLAEAGGVVRRRHAWRQAVPYKHLLDEGDYPGREQAGQVP